MKKVDIKKVDVKKVDMKKYAKRILWLSLVVFCMAAIFIFSQQDRQSSAELSQSFIKKLAEIFIEGFETLTAKEQISIINDYKHVVRKAAHFTLFFILGGLLTGFMYTYRLQNRYRVCLAVIVAAAYAATDEFHQMFVPGRGPSVNDVGIDVLGAASGIAVFMASYKIIGKFRYRNHDACEHQTL